MTMTNLKDNKRCVKCKQSQVSHCRIIVICNLYIFLFVFRISLWKVKIQEIARIWRTLRGSTRPTSCRSCRNTQNSEVSGHERSFCVHCSLWNMWCNHYQRIYSIRRQILPATVWSDCNHGRHRLRL